MLNFLHLVISPPESSVLYTGNFDPVLVSPSVVVAIFASYASLLVSQHVSTTSTAATRRMWITVGGLCLGKGFFRIEGDEGVEGPVLLYAREEVARQFDA